MPLPSASPLLSSRPSPWASAAVGRITPHLLRKARAAAAAQGPRGRPPCRSISAARTRRTSTPSRTRPTFGSPPAARRTSPAFRKPEHAAGGRSGARHREGPPSGSRSSPSRISTSAARSRPWTPTRSSTPTSRRRSCSSTWTRRRPIAARSCRRSRPSPPTDPYAPDNLLAAAPRPGFVLSPHHTYAFVVKKQLDDAAGKPLGVPDALATLASGGTPGRRPRGEGEDAVRRALARARHGRRRGDRRRRRDGVHDGRRRGGSRARQRRRRRQIRHPDRRAARRPDDGRSRSLLRDPGHRHGIRSSRTGPRRSRPAAMFQIRFERRAR